MSLNWKLFPVQWRKIFEKYQNLTKWRSYEKKVYFLAYKMVIFSMPNRQFSCNQKYRHCRVNIFNSSQYKFQVNRIIAL